MAWLIRAGFELDFENEQDRSSTHCEFTATYVPTGEKYSVEAKSRQMRLGGAARTPVGKQLRKALVKKADHKRLVFIDLNKALLNQETTSRALDRAEFIIKQSEKTMEIDGAPAPPAYVCITNMNDQHAKRPTRTGWILNRHHGFFHRLQASGLHGRVCIPVRGSTSKGATFSDVPAYEIYGRTS